MISSLRIKLFLGMTGIIVLFVVLSYLLNTFYLGQYYMAQKKETLTQSYNMLNTHYRGSLDDITIDIEKLERLSGINVTLSSANFQVKYSTQARPPLPIISTEDSQPVFAPLQDPYDPRPGQPPAGQNTAQRPPRGNGQPPRPADAQNQLQPGQNPFPVRPPNGNGQPPRPANAQNQPPPRLNPEPVNQAVINKQNQTPVKQNTTPSVPITVYVQQTGASTAQNQSDKRQTDQDPITNNMRLIRADSLQLKNTPIVFETTSDPRLKNNFLNLIARLNNGDYLLLSTSISAIEESAAIANRFSLFTGLLTIILGGVIVYLFARRTTSPILELKAIAQRMALLDFSKKYEGRSNDEISELGSSINVLSDQLDHSISALRQANEKLQQDIEQKRQIDEMRKEFVSSVSHELKTPISLIQGYAEGLKTDVITDEENKNYYCDVIIDEAAKMDKTVRQLLDLTQIESGHMQLERTNFDISAFLDHVLEKYTPVLSEKKAALIMEKDESVIVNADPVRTEQVLVNYITNAIDHIDQAGTIRIKIATDNRHARISVYNSGPRIPDDSLDMIWTSFYKVDKARTRAYGGTGLGLSIVKAIQELQGNVYGAMNLKDGVEFWFELDKA
ncbi:MAG: ATP-binding protein [Acidobacteriota bacterium]